MLGDSDNVNSAGLQVNGEQHIVTGLAQQARTPQISIEGPIRRSLTTGSTKIALPLSTLVLPAVENTARIRQSRLFFADVLMVSDVAPDT